MILNSRQKAAFYMVLGALSFSFLMMLNKSLDPCLPSFVVVWIRVFAGLCAVLPLLWVREGQTVTQSFGIQILRGILIVAALFCTYTAYRHLPCASAALIGTSGPLFIIFFGWIFLNEHMGRRQLILLALGYMGVLLILNPVHFEMNRFAWASVGANLFMGMAIALARLLALRGESSLTTLLYGTFVPLVFFSIAAFWTWVPIGWDQIGIITVMGILGSVSQLCTLNALRHVPASFLAPFEYLRPCFVIPLGWFLYGEIPQGPLWIGAFLILTSNFFLVFRK